jgi:hypothetical protein
LETDAYASLKAHVQKRLASRPVGQFILARYQNDPVTWSAPLAIELAEAGADTDTDLLAAATTLLTLIDPGGSQAGKYNVSMQGTRGVQVGDGNSQHNIETYIHTQVVHPPKKPDSQAVGKKASAKLRKKTDGRVRAASLLASIDPAAGQRAYAEIVWDANAGTDGRVRAASLLASIDRAAGQRAYAEIARSKRS